MKVSESVRVSGCTKLMEPFEVVMSPPIWMAPVPFCTKLPPVSISELEVKVAVPELVRVKVPDPVVRMRLLTVRAPTVKPILPVVVMEPAGTKAAVVLTVREVRGVVPPTAPARVIVPVPAFRVKFELPELGPSMVLRNSMLAPVPDEAFVATVLVPCRMTGLLKITAAFLVDTLSPTVIDPPVTVMAPRGVVPPIAPEKVTDFVPTFTVRGTVPAAPVGLMVLLKMTLPVEVREKELS